MIHRFYRPARNHPLERRQGASESLARLAGSVGRRPTVRRRGGSLLLVVSAVGLALGTAVALASRPACDPTTQACRAGDAKAVLGSISGADGANGSPGTDGMNGATGGDGGDAEDGSSALTPGVGTASSIDPGVTVTGGNGGRGGDGGDGGDGGSRNVGPGAAAAPAATVAAVATAVRESAAPASS